MTLRKTVIKGETAHGDYLVLEDGNRIRLGHGLNGAMRWYWSVTVHDPARTAAGCGDTMEEAKAAFKKAWERDL